MTDFAERRLVFRADGNATIGLGHIVRLMALADILGGLAPGIFLVREPSAAVEQLLTDAGWLVYALPAEPLLVAEAEWLADSFLLPTDVLLLDGYSFDFAYQRSVRRSGCGLVFIDDLQAWPVAADILINHSPGIVAAAYQAPSTTKFLLGPAFSLLRQPFLEAARQAHTSPKPGSALVCFGGADPLGLTARSLEALATLPQIERVSLVVGSAFRDIDTIEKLIKKLPALSIELHSNIGAAALVELLLHHAVAILPASTVLIEALVLARPAITGYYAANQEYLANYVHQHEQAFSVGDFAALSSLQLAVLLRQGLKSFSSYSPRPYTKEIRPDLLRAAVYSLLNR